MASAGTDTATSPRAAMTGSFLFAMFILALAALAAQR